ncbi:hypothetical protein GQ53DRAFT_837845 [Thozetella sp. PMI_491]|nr:hypothetical protein GQ53DRAFT_837845 [Thozetella sp. PMI_491]
MEGKTTPSRPWADTPYALLEIPSKSQDVSHPALHIANEMSHAHNCMVRGLNAIYHQAPHVKKSADAADLIFLVASWVTWLTDHHHLEENMMFPGFEGVLGQPGLLTAAVEQHHAFERALDDLRQYAALPDVAEKFDAGELRKRIEALGPPLREHLGDEIQFLQRMREFCQGESGEKKAQELLRVYKTCEAEAGKQDKFVVPPMVMGLRDKTYEGGEGWPQIPGGVVTESVIACVLSLKNKGAWRFLPCDHWGRPRPLAFGEEEQ